MTDDPNSCHRIVLHMGTGPAMRRPCVAAGRRCYRCLVESTQYESSLGSEMVEHRSCDRREREANTRKQLR
jgi:hypothetical protein